MIRLKFTDAKSYLNYINSNYEEIEKFLSGFTINTSYLFRNREVFEQVAHIIYQSMKTINKSVWKSHLEKKIFNNFSLEPQNVQSNKSFLQYLPELSIYKKFMNPTNSTLYFWSCACAAGEEPYSLAIMLDNFSQNTLNFPNYKIVASDIDKDTLELALRGIYNEESMKEVPNTYQTKYFKTLEHRFGLKYLIDEKIKNSVEFIREDITKGHQKSYKYDIIFCRYFLIYTDKELRDKFINILEDKLAYGGLLVLGKTETLFNTRKSLKLIDTKNHIYLKRKIYN